MVSVAPAHTATAVDVTESHTMEIHKDPLEEESMMGNYSNVTGEVLCGRTLPSAQELFRSQPSEAAIAMAVGCACSLFTCIVFAEEFRFLVNNFRRKRKRMTKTIWVLALYPIFSITSLLGALIPRAGCLVDLVANVYFASVMYEFVRLMVDYMGGERRMWACMADTSIKLRSPPCCCCCCCLPTVKFTKSTYLKLQLMVLQVAIFRPILFFTAAVLWSNGSYIPGMIAWDNAYIYITILNLFSTFWAVYGLVLTQKAFCPFLPDFHLMGKFLSIQIVLICTIIINLLLNILVASKSIPCVPLLNSAARGDRITHWVIVLLMAPLCLLGRKFFRRKEEAYKIADNAKAADDIKQGDVGGNEGLMYTKETPNV